MKTGAIICCCCFVCFVVVLLCLFCTYFRDMISIATYRVQILCCYYVTSELGEILSYKGLGQLTLISFRWTSQSNAGLWISDLDFHCNVFAFCILYCQNFSPNMFWGLSNLLDTMLRLHSYQPCPQDYCTNIQYNPKDGMLWILLLIGVI